MNTYLLFVLGNGFDSHRIWEALYSDSIPVVFDHSFSTLDDLPKIKISNLKQLNDIIYLITLKRKNLYMKS